MSNAIESLLKDHRMIRKILEGFDVSNPRFPAITETLQRVVLAHAWYEDEFFMPAARKERLLQKVLVDEMYQEHQDLDHLLQVVRAGASAPSEELELNALQLTSVLRTHLLKEEESIFPIAQRVMSQEGLLHMTQEMERRKKDVLDFLERKLKK